MQRHLISCCPLRNSNIGFLKKMITVQTDIGNCVERAQHALVASREFSFSSALHDAGELFRQDWKHLEPDPYMADGGKYRFRRYGLFRLSAASGHLSHIPSASFYQSININPLNGGEHRHFAPLAADTVKNPFLHELMQFDLAQLTSNRHIGEDWLIGVHQIRIIATTGVQGNPTPEGIHRDDETYTSQHLIARHNISGGINYFYGSGPKPTKGPQAVWKQESYFDSYYFDRSLWHSVSPITCGIRNDDGHRDVILIDFVKSSKVH
jgi:hypothetical protein